MTMNRVLKILHFLVLAYSGVVSTLLLLKDASQLSSIDFSLVFDDFRSYLFNPRSLGLFIFILGLCFFARDSLMFFVSLLSIVVRVRTIAIINDSRDDLNHEAVPKPTRTQFGEDTELETTEEYQALVDQEVEAEAEAEAEPEQEQEEEEEEEEEEKESPALASFKNYLVDHLGTINELVVLFGPSNEEEEEEEEENDQKKDIVHSTTTCNDVEKEKLIEQQFEFEEQHEPDTTHIPDQTFDSLQIDYDQFLTMVEHQVEKVNNKDIEGQQQQQQQYEIFDHSQLYVEDGLSGASIYHDNEISIQAHDMTSIIPEEVVDVIPEEETKSLEETWENIERLLSSQSKHSPREKLMPQTPRRMRRKVAKLKSSSILESRDTNEWKDKRKTLSFNEEVYLRQRGGLIRNNISEDAESLNKKFDEFIAKNKQELLIQRQESNQRFLEKTSRGG